MINYHLRRRLGKVLMLYIANAVEVPIQSRTHILWVRQNCKCMYMIYCKIYTKNGSRNKCPSIHIDLIKILFERNEEVF